jgi:hypothetical protein
MHPAYAPIYGALEDESAEAAGFAAKADGAASASS